MRTQHLACGVLVGVLLAAPVWSADKAEDAAQEVAESWLKLVDAASYEASCQGLRVHRPQLFRFTQQHHGFFFALIGASRNPGKGYAQVPVYDPVSRLKLQGFPKYGNGHFRVISCKGIDTFGVQLFPGMFLPSPGQK